MPDGQQLVLAQNQHAFIQDATKGTVQVYAGPHSLGLSPNDKPVVYEATKDEYFPSRCRKQSNRIHSFQKVTTSCWRIHPSSRTARCTSQPNGPNSPSQLQIGRKINIAGPTTFPLWPGQFAKAIPGHHLRSNQYLVVRVYNAEQANKKFRRPSRLSRARNCSRMVNSSSSKAPRFHSSFRRLDLKCCRRTATTFVKL